MIRSTARFESSRDSGIPMQFRNSCATQSYRDPALCFALYQGYRAGDMAAEAATPRQILIFTIVGGVESFF
jgi:hypothetical protein